MFSCAITTSGSTTSAHHLVCREHLKKSAATPTGCNELLLLCANAGYLYASNDGRDPNIIWRPRSSPINLIFILKICTTSTTIMTTITIRIMDILFVTEVPQRGVQRTHTLTHTQIPLHEQVKRSELWWWWVFDLKYTCNCPSLVKAPPLMRIEGGRTKRIVILKCFHHSELAENAPFCTSDGNRHYGLLS